MRTIFMKMSQRLSLSEGITTSHNVLTRYGQLLIYLVSIGAIAYFYILAHGMFMQYFSNLGLGALYNPAN